jgi:multiple sugar transport system permease protein
MMMPHHTVQQQDSPTPVWVSLRRMAKQAVLPTISVGIGTLFLFPIYWIVVNSFKTDLEIFQSPPTLLPHQLTFKAYTSQLVGEFNVYGPLLNSCLIATGSMLLAMLFAVPAAYGLARYRLRGSRLMIFTFLITQMLPATLLLTPMYLTYAKAGILNTHLAPILSDCTISIPFVVLILRTYFLGLPKGVEDAAKIDGCNRFQVFLRIILPMSSPGLVMAGAFSFLFAWNDLIYAMTFMTKKDLWPMTAGIYNFMGKYGTQWNAIMAYGALLVVPVIVMFVFLQKYIVSGLTQGAVKE